VAWTDNGPKMLGATLRHQEAEGILHGPISAAYVELSDSELTARAGAPPSWRGKWRCLAIVNDDIGNVATDLMPAKPASGRKAT
jgi:hypothetical protein